MVTCKQNGCRKSARWPTHFCSTHATTGGIPAKQVPRRAQKPTPELTQQFATKSRGFAKDCMVANNEAEYQRVKGILRKVGMELKLQLATLHSIQGYPWLVAGDFLLNRKGTTWLICEMLCLILDVVAVVTIDAYAWRQNKIGAPNWSSDIIRWSMMLPSIDHAVIICWHRRLAAVVNDDRQADGCCGWWRLSSWLWLTAMTIVDLTANRIPRQFHSREDWSRARKHSS